MDNPSQHFSLTRRALTAVVLFAVVFLCACAACITSAQAETPHHDPATLTVHYIDVGQGDSEFIELPGGQTMLIDAGTTESGSTVVSYVKDLGYSKIDYVVATHPHEDHIGGMSAVLGAFDVGSIWAPKVSHNTATFEKFLDKAAQKGGITAASSGMTITSSSNCTASILSPKEGATYKDMNDYSVIVDIAYGGKTFLFTGDASSSVTKATNPGHVDVLKVGHHGSKTATTKSLVTELSPTYAVISVGEGNTYGHPNDSVLKALSGVDVMRTDQKGSITCTCTSAGDISFSFKKDESKTSNTDADSTTMASAAAAAADPTDSDAPSADTVYVTTSGKKYHSDGCIYLKKSKIAISLIDAKEQGYTACSKCGPPA